MKLGPVLGLGKCGTYFFARAQVLIVQPTDLEKHPLPPDISVDHAGKMETAEALYLCPELVHMKNLELPNGQVIVPIKADFIASTRTIWYIATYF